MRIIITILACLFVAACQQNRIEEELRQFSQETIVLSNDMVKISPDGNVSQEFNNRGLNFIMYHDSLSCTSCAINNLHTWDRIYELADSLQSFDIINIFSPKGEDIDDFYELLLESYFKHPVYLDCNGSFKRDNKCIPTDNRFHYFLIDETGKIILIGNPLASDKLWDLYSTTLKNSIKY